MSRIIRPLNALAVFIAFVLTPVWLRIPAAYALSPLYIGRFLLLIPMLIAIVLWLIAGLPGLTSLRRTLWAGMWAALLLSYALWGFFSQSWAFMSASKPEIAANAALQFGIVALFALVTASGVLSPRRLLLALSLSLAFNAALATAQALTQGDLGLRALGEFPFSPRSRGASILIADGLRYVRPYGLLPHPNILAGVLLPGLFAASALILGDRSRFLRWFGVAALSLGTAALLLTFSRAAWLGAAGGALVFLLLALPVLCADLWGRGASRSLLPTLVASAALVGAVFIGFVVRYTPFISARAGIGEESLELRSVSDRIVFTNFALRAIRERPLLGVGVGNLPWRASDYLRDEFYDLQGDYVHQIYLAAAADLGLIGLALYGGALVCGMIAGIRAVRASRGVERTVRAALLSAALAFMIIGLFDHYPYTLLQPQTAFWGCLAAALTPSFQATA
ncbi:MAG: O-antigen ligase family protein [Anaerolineae bacterium]|nr:O-antigen ligase family protein [Anaerolineae bacterium]